MVKLSLYRHFTNTLIFAVIASVLFMVYMIKVNQLSRCAPVSVSWVEELEFRRINRHFYSLLRLGEMYGLRMLFGTSFSLCSYLSS